MRRPSRGHTEGLVRILVAAFLLAAILPLAPVKAASGPSLSYSVTPQAYNNTVKVANSTDMVAPRVAVGPDPTGAGSLDVYVIGVDDNSCRSLVTVRSTDGGQTFGAPQKAPLCLGGWEVDVVVAPNGTLIVSAAGPRIYRSFDRGATWAQAAVLDSTTSGGTLAWDPVSGDVYAAWNSLVAVSRDGGATWSRTPSSPPILATVLQPSIAAYGGHIVVAFTDWHTDTPYGPFGTETTGVVTSPDGGTTWSEVKDLAPSGSAYRVNAPSATASGAGVFAVTWTAMANNYTIWTLVSVSRDAGVTWSAAFPAAEGGEVVVALTPGRSAVFDRAGRLFTAWHSYSGAFANVSVASSDADLASFNESSFAIRFQAGGGNNTLVCPCENLAADNASRVFLVWEFPSGSRPPVPEEGVFVRTVTGTATGDVQWNATAVVASATVTLRSTTAGGPVRQVTWTGPAFLLPELPPDGYEVWIDSGQGSALAGTIPVQPWSATAFTVYASNAGTGPPPAPFPWLLAGVLVGGLILLGAVLPIVQYTRLTRETVLQRKARLLLYEYVSDHPGSSFTAVRDAFGLRNGAASYHLAVLEKQGLLHSETKRRRHFYYPNGNAALWKDSPLSEIQDSILRAVRGTPGIGLRELSRAIGREPSSVGYNVKALAREGLLRTDRDGLRVRCYPTDGVASK